MISGIAALVAGIGVLAVASDQFVIGAARVAVIRRVPALVVGVVIIGFGTSAPELLVSALAAARGEPEIALGNVVGSNVANLSLLLGVGAIVVPIAVASRTVRREAPLVVLAGVLLLAAVQGGGVGRVEGAGLLVAMAVCLWVVIRGGGEDPLGPEAVELADAAHHDLRVEVLRTAAGLVGTVASAQLVLWGAIRIADRLDLPDGFVGATIVAVGTSLPELVTVLQSARRGETDLVVGNLLGSNLFNALAVAGVFGLVGGTGIDDASLTITGPIVALTISVAAALAMLTRFTVTRREGVLLVLAYVAAVPLLL